jgi:hypothetical protein
MLLHAFVGGVMVGLVALRRGLTGLAAAVKIGPYLSSSSATLKRPSPAQTNMLGSFDQLRLQRVFDRYVLCRQARARGVLPAELCLLRAWAPARLCLH